MRSLILQMATRYLVPLMLLFSVFLFFAGHEEPGGGFVGGLVASAAFALYAIAFSVEGARRALIVTPLQLMGAGLSFVIVSGLYGLLQGEAFLTGFWSDLELPVGSIGTPVTFDFGIYLGVIGVVLTIVFELAESEEQEAADETFQRHHERDLQSEDSH